MSDLSTNYMTTLIPAVLEMSGLLLMVFVLLGLPAFAVFWLLRERPVWLRGTAAAACVVLMSIVVPVVMFFFPMEQHAVNYQRAN